MFPARIQNSHVHQLIIVRQIRTVEAVVATLRGVPLAELHAPTRRRAPVARARQMVAYLCHTTLSLPYSTVAHYMRRDRTTISHACRVIEDLRDHQRFDTLMRDIEATVRRACNLHVSTAARAASA